MIELLHTIINSLIEVFTALLLSATAAGVLWIMAILSYSFFGGNDE